MSDMRQRGKSNALSCRRNNPSSQKKIQNRKKLSKKTKRSQQREIEQLYQRLYQIVPNIPTQISESKFIEHVMGYIKELEVSVQLSGLLQVCDHKLYRCPLLPKNIGTHQQHKPIDVSESSDESGGSSCSSPTLQLDNFALPLSYPTVSSLTFAPTATMQCFTEDQM